MVIATRPVWVNGQEWEHWVAGWLHTMSKTKAAVAIRIEWRSGDDGNCRFSVDSEEAERGQSWLTYIDRVHDEEGGLALKRRSVAWGRFFVMFPFHRNEMTSDDEKQLANLPP